MITCIGHSGSLDLFSINGSLTPSEAPDSPSHLLTLRLPPLLGHRQLRSISTHSAPHLAQPQTLQTPFTQIQGRRIHLVQLHYGDLLPQYTLYVKNEYLMGLVEQMLSRTGVYDLTQEAPPKTPPLVHFPPGGSPPSVETVAIPSTARLLSWHQWGPLNTRFLQQSLHFQWLR